MPILHPYTELTGGQWLRGNLHTHTTASDGRRPLQAVVDDYAARGYDFLMISDHDVYSDPDTLAACDARGMTLLPGNEISRGGPHLLHVGATGFVEPDPDRQRVIDAIGGAGGFAVVNHPNWQGAFDHCPLASMQAWTGYAGMEIYNGVIGRLDGSPYATNKWDMLLAQGRRIWGFANDDSHGADDVGLGWNRVYSRDRTAAGLVEAMRQGCFYASTGIEITDITVTGDRIRIATANARRIVALQQTGRRLATADADAIEVAGSENASYIRFECWGDGEQFAWTQPFFIERG